MIQLRLFDSELKIMEVLWKEGDVTASQISKILQREIGWSRNTTYTVIKKNISKGAIQRIDPNFLCRALVSKEEVQSEETDELINKMFNGSKLQFFSTFLNGKNLTSDEVTCLKKIVEDLSDEN